MSNKMCMDTSMFMLYNMTEIYAGLLNGEQTDVTSEEDLPDVTPTPKKGEREESQSMLTHGDSSLSILLDRLMFNKLCTDASMRMLTNMANMYARLLNGEQTDVTSADNLFVSTLH